MLGHIGSVRTVAQGAILTGNPDRVDLLIAALGTESSRWVRRGYICVEASTDTGPVIVCSTGIGGPSTAIAVEELGRLGITSFVRVGTCGSLQREVVRPGDLVMSTACVRDEGTSLQYLPDTYPSVSDFALLRGMARAAEAERVPHHIGITHAKDAYYGEDPRGHVLAGVWEQRWTALRAAGVLATEMEAAALFAVATVRGWRAAGVYVVVDDDLPDERLNESLAAATRIARCALAGAPR